MSLRSPLGRVRGLGTAKEGVSHWWAQRLTALALVPLTIWFVVSIAALTGADYAMVREWVGSPLVASLLILLIVAVFYHSYLGLQVVMEDYVHHEGIKIGGLIVIQGLSILLAVIGIVSVLRLLLAG